MCVTDEDVKLSLQWLEHNRDIDEIQPHWQRTAVFRHSDLIATVEKGLVKDYFEKYPVLVDPISGPKLINIDFNQLYECPVNDLSFGNWDPFFQKLCNVTAAKRLDPEAKKLKAQALDYTIDQRKSITLCH